MTDHGYTVTVRNELRPHWTYYGCVNTTVCNVKCSIKRTHTNHNILGVRVAMATSVMLQRE